MNTILYARVSTTAQAVALQQTADDNARLRRTTIGLDVVFRGVTVMGNILGTT